MTIEEFVTTIAEYSCEEYFEQFPEIDTTLENIEKSLSVMGLESRGQVLSYLEAVSENMPVWAQVHVLSFVMAVGKKASVAEKLLQVILDADYDEIGEYSKLSHYWQINRALFLDSNLASEGVKTRQAKLYRVLMDAFSGALGVNTRNYIPIEDRNKDFVIVFAAQVLGLGHAPTKTLLDRCYVLKKVLNKEVLIINTAMHMTRKGRAPFYNIYESQYADELKNNFYLEFKDERFEYYQCPDEMPDLNEMVKILSVVRARKPYYIINIGGGDICADICGRIVPEITVSTVFSGVSNSCAEYQIVDKQVLSETDKECLEILGTTPEKIKQTMFTFVFKEQTHYYTREMLGLPVDKFLLAVVGWRLDNEVTNEFLEMLQAIVERERQIGVVFVGQFLQYEKRIQEYPLLAQNAFNIGKQDDVLAVFECVDLYVNTKRNGGGSSVSEALYKGVPAVTLPIGDVSVAAGEMFHVKGYEEMVTQILRYQKDEMYYQEMSAMARKRAGLLLDSTISFGKTMKEIEESVS